MLRLRPDVLLWAERVAAVPWDAHAWISSYSHMKPPEMPAEAFQLVILLCTVAGLSPLPQPEP